LWKTLGLSLESLLDSVTKELGKKPELLAINIKCATSGFEFDPEIALEKVTLPVAIDQNVEKMFIDGNRALAMGAIAGGLRAYYGYPMSPSTTILDYIAKTYHKTGILVKQAEDEISAVQMAIGSMYMGTRAMTSTSGGGFALMTETVSMSACNEIPLVVAISQRPGPATGLPTWTGQADLDLCLGAGHGEFTRCIIACSDPVSSFDNSQLAFNIAEKYQIPVMLLTEANISMSSLTVLPFEQGKIAIDRGLSTDIESRDERYEDTPSGISKRWIPGSSQHTFFCNTDEHWADGSTTEDAAQTIKMIDKRLRKTQTLLAELPEPVLYGNSKAAVAYIGWGSTLGTMLDSIDQGADLCYLHYNVVFPLKTDKLNELFATHPNIHIIEGNATGQLANLIHKYTDHKAPKFLKYDGRPFYLEEVLEHCRKNTK
jgi:2-oxoglutarate ferredoxin oxidoreductase subunit alpha